MLINCSQTRLYKVSKVLKIILVTYKFSLKVIYSDNNSSNNNLNKI